MCRLRQRHFIGENADLSADLRIFYNFSGLAVGVLKQGFSVSKVRFDSAP
jgi:hypothetical protein